MKNLIANVTTAGVVARFLEDPETPHRTSLDTPPLARRAGRSPLVWIAGLIVVAMAALAVAVIAVGQDGTDTAEQPTIADQSIRAVEGTVESRTGDDALTDHSIRAVEGTVESGG